MPRREFGSDFHFPLPACAGDAPSESFLFSPGFSLFVSGRSALYALLAEGIREFGWTKVYFPSYYCHEVVEFVNNPPVEVNYYRYNPAQENIDPGQSPDDTKGAVIINVDYFGLKKLQWEDYSEATIVDDLTHNLQAWKDSKADFCFGSLRKDLPVPVGGFCFSKSHAVPAAYDPALELLAARKLSGMFLKKEYLEGNADVSKEVFRELLISGEKEFGDLKTNAAIPGISRALLESLDVEKITEAKISNGQHGLKLLGEIPGTRINFGKDKAGFGLVLELSSSRRRDSLKACLIHQNIFPAVLWPDQKYDRDADLERKLLFVHMDYRHSKEDVEFICNTIKECLAHE